MRKAAVGKCVLLCLSVLCVLLCLSVFCVCSCDLLYLLGCYRGLEMWKIRCRSCSQIKLKVVLLHSALLGWEGQPWLTTFLQLSHCRIHVNTFSDWLLWEKTKISYFFKRRKWTPFVNVWIYTTYYKDSTMDWVLCPIRKYASPFPLYRPFLSQLHSHMNRHDIRPNFRQKVRTLRHCNNTLPRGGMFWKIRPLRQSRGPRGANCRAREGGVFCCFPIHSDSRQCITILFSRAEVYWI